MSEIDKKEIERRFEKISRYEISPETTAGDLEKTRRTLSGLTSQPQPMGQNIWSNIMRSKISKLAAAAVITVAVFIGIHYSGGSIDGASVALAQVTENIKKMPWLYTQTTSCYEENGEEKKYRSECWYSFQSEVMITKNMDGHINFYDLHDKNKKIYDPDSNTLTVSYMSADEYDLRTRNYPELPAELLTKIIKSLKSKGATVEYEKSQYAGREVDVYNVKLPSEMDVNNTYYGVQKLVVDRKQKLLIASEIRSWDNRENVGETSVHYEYPENGPRDVYELGAPRTARVISLDETPLELDGILETLRYYRDKFSQQYIAIVVSSLYARPAKAYYVESANIFFIDKDTQRMERLLLNNPWQQVKNIKPEMGSTFESQFKWWRQDRKEDSGIKCDQIDLYDGKNFYVFRQKNGKGPWLTQTKVSNFIESRISADPVNPVGLAWPKTIPLRFGTAKISIIEDEYSKANNLICIEMLRNGEKRINKVTRLPRKCLYYINPEKDYICQRAEYIDQLDAPWQNDPKWLDGIRLKSVEQKDWTLIMEVLEYGQTDSKKWYPKKIRSKQIWADQSEEEKEKNKGRILSIYIKENPAFADGIFSPDNLPAVNE